jgi:hypothetical protein
MFIIFLILTVLSTAGIESEAICWLFGAFITTCLLIYLLVASPTASADVAVVGATV